MKIIVDSREQRPYWKGQGFIRKSLIVGDYTTSKLIGSFHIERKSPQDLYSTVTKGHYRFRKEVFRAFEHGIELWVVVESSKKAFINLCFPGGTDRKMKPETLRKIINTIQKRYNLKIVWIRNRELAKKYVLRTLSTQERKLWALPIATPKATK